MMVLRDFRSFNTQNIGKKSKQIKSTILLVLLTVSILLVVQPTIKSTASNQLNSESQITKNKAIGDAVWDKTFGGSSEDDGLCVDNTSDGGYIITGYTFSFGAGESDIWLIKTYANGTEEWNRTYGGPQDDRGVHVKETSDGGYIIVGWSAGLGDIFLMKTDFNGTQEWNQTFESGTGEFVEQTMDGGYIIIGSKQEGYIWGENDVWLIKTDANGNKEWDKTYGLSEKDDGGYYGLQTNDGEYIITGFTESYTTSEWPDVWLIKTDSNGDVLWHKTFGEYWSERGYCIEQTSDGGYIILSELSDDVWLIKTNEIGNLLWSKTHLIEEYVRGLGCVEQTKDGGYIISGTAHSYEDDNDDIFLLKTDSNGEKEWEKTYGGTGDDWCEYGVQTSDEGYIITGYTDSYGAGGADVWLIKDSGEAPSQPSGNGEGNGELLLILVVGTLAALVIFIIIVIKKK